MRIRIEEAIKRFNRFIEEQKFNLMKLHPASSTHDVLVAMEIVIKNTEDDRERNIIVGAFRNMLHELEKFAVKS